MREKVEWGSQKNTQILNRSELKTANRIVWNQQLNLTSSATSRAWRTAHDFSQTNGYSVYYKQSYIPFIPMTEYFQCSHSKTELPLPPPPHKKLTKRPDFHSLLQTSGPQISWVWDYLVTNWSWSTLSQRLSSAFSSSTNFKTGHEENVEKKPLLQSRAAVKIPNSV